MKRNQWLTPASVATAFLLWADPITADDAAAIQGTWTLVSAEDSGRAYSAEKLKEFRMVITADAITVVRNGMAHTPMKYKLDPSKNPKWIDWIGKRTQLGIYALSGDELKLCLNEGTTADTVRATAFESKRETENDMFWVLKREASATK